MITLTKEFRRALAANDRNYDARAVIILEDSTRIELQGDEIWSDGFSIEDAVSDDESFTALGSTVINAATLIIDNTKDKYIDYNFNNADVTLFITKTFGERTEDVKMGTYRVDDTKYDEATITLSMLDLMEQFDRPYTPINFPASLESIVRDACAVCLGTASKLATQTFPHSQFMIQEAPTDEACTYREVISWCATIAGCFARCNRNGELELKWFNTAALEDTSGTDGGEFDSTSGSYYQTGDAVDGGTFSPWSTGAEVDGGNFTDNIPLHYIGSLYSQTICVDETVITGVQIEVEDPDPQAEVKTETYMEGQPGYIIQVSKNPFITKDNVEEILAWLADELVGLRFRKCNVTHADDPSIEAGDVAFLYDSRQREYPILITRHAFEIGGPQTIVCGCETPARNQATRYTAVTKAYVENRKQLKQQKNAYEEALQELAEDIAENAHGLYAEEIDDPDDPNAKIYCLHDKPDIDDSDVQIRLSTVGIVVTANGTAQTPTWYGLRVNGDMITRIMNTIGINFDWGTGGTLKLGGQNNTNGSLELYNASGKKIGSIDNTGANLTGNMVTKMENVNVFADFLSAQAGFANDVPTSRSSTRIWELWAKADRTTEGVTQPRHIREIQSTQPGFSSKSYRGINSDNPDLRFIICHDEKTRRGTSLLFDQLYSSGNEISTAHSNPELVYRNEAYGVSGLWIHGGLTYKDHPLGVTDKKDDVFFTVKKNYIYWGNYPDANSNAGGLRTDISRAYCEEDDEYVMQSDLNAVLFKISPEVVAMGNSGGQYMDSSPGIYLTETIARINGQSVAFQSSSSLRYKHNIKPIEDKALDPHKLLKLPVVQFEWNKDHNLQYPDMAGQTIPGIIAEDVEKIYPAATIHKDGKVESWDERRIIPGMLALIQEQDKTIKEQQARLDELEKKLESLTRVVEAYTMKL